MISLPLLRQSIKANWILWVATTISLVIILSILNIIMGNQELPVGITEEQFRALGALDPRFITNPTYLMQIFGILELDQVMTLLSEGIDVTLIVNEMFYTLAGMLLVMIYIIIVSNNLIASQVDRGSMAYILSTPTKRITVILTQLLYLIVSSFLIIVVLLVFDLITHYIGYGEIDVVQSLLMNFGFFITMIGLSGITFFASTYFNLSKHSLALGGGSLVFFLIAKVLGMFGTDVFVTAGVGVEKMNIFNYFTIISFFDAKSISELSDEFIWKFAILLGIAIVFYTLGIIKFIRKDLPL